MRRLAITTIGAIFAVALIGPTSASAYEGFSISGMGRATIDGVATAGEWSKAGSTTFAVNMPDGTTRTATLFEMNDRQNLYVGLELPESGYRDLSLTLEFDNDAQGDWPEQGDDAYVFSYTYDYLPAPGHFDQEFTDDFRHYADGLDQWWGPPDVDYGGSNDGSGMTASDGATRFVELSHPLDSGDVGHDMAVGLGSTVGVHLSLRLFGGQYGTDTEFPMAEYYPYGNWGFGRFTIVGYDFQGFESPVNNPPVQNAATAGRAIPLKWRVLDGGGVPVTDLTSARVTVSGLSCDLGTTDDQIEEYAAGGSGLQNLGDGYYQFNWKTPKTYAGSCKTVNVDVGDGIVHSAVFSFAR